MPVMDIAVQLSIDGIGAPLGGARFRLFERDVGKQDRLLGAGVVGADGRATLGVDTLVLADVDELQSAPGPELVAELLDPADAVIYRGPARFTPTSPPRIDVMVPLAAVADASTRLKQRNQPSAADVVTRWKKETARPGPGPAPDPCLRRALLDTLAGLAKPETTFQKKVAKAAHLHMLTPAFVAEFPGVATAGSRPVLSDKGLAGLGRLSAAAQRLVKAMDAANLGTPACNAKLDAGALAARILESLPDTTKLLRALHEAEAVTFPEEEKPAKAGDAFQTQHQFRTSCVRGYESGGLTAEARKQMDQLGAAQGARSYTSTTPPRINHVDVLDPKQRAHIYGADVATKRLEVLPLDGGLTSEVIDFDVPLTAPLAGQVDRRIVKRTDAVVAGEARQILMIDVVKGQKIRLQGSGFFQPEATLLCRRHGWQAQPDDGMLVPIDGIAATDALGSLPVHGGNIPRTSTDTPETYVGDSVVIEWPFDTPGLYEVKLLLSTRKPDGTRYVTFGPQFESCLIPGMTSQVPDNLESNTIWLAVIPAMRRVRIFPRIAEVTCVDKTNVGPIESWADTIRVVGRLERLTFEANPLGPPPIAMGSRQDDVEFQQVFRDDGESRVMNRDFQQAGFASHPDFAELLLKYELHASELLDEDERFLIKLAERVMAFIVVFIIIEFVGHIASLAFLILFPLLMLAGIATVTAGGVGLLVLAAGAGPTALNVSIGILKLADQILTPIVTRLFHDVDAVLWAWLEAELGSRTVVFATPHFTLAELFLRASPFRFFSRYAHPPRGTDSGFREDLVWEWYTGKAHGGEYKLKLEMRLEPPA